ncbi:MAG: hypothetical protein HY067_06160 [Betaproteobacteria bacterium]|nr:hypothetical protein [Betaproteobacteria bacterium]
MIAAAIAALGFASGALAQKGAAEKAQEGGIDHWIEYYKAEQRKPAATSPQERTVAPINPAAPVDRAAPVERTESGASQREKTERK